MIVSSFLQRLSRPSALSGSMPCTPGPSFSHVSRNALTLPLSACTSRMSLALKPRCVRESSSVRTPACLMSLRHDARSTVFLSISTFSMKPGGRLYSSIWYMSITGSISMSIPDSRSRTSRNRSIMKRSVSRSSTPRFSLPSVRRMYSESDSRRSRAFLCRLSEYVTFQFWHSLFSCSLSVRVLSDSAPML